jgi:glyoxylase I family protein
MTLGLKFVHHIAVICSDYERSRHFYTKILGLPIICETYREARKSYKLDLAVGSHCQIELFSFPNVPPRPSYPEACGLRHLAFAVGNLTNACDWLESQKVLVEPIRYDELTSKHFTFFADPDGLPIELYEE